MGLRFHFVFSLFLSFTFLINVSLATASCDQASGLPDEVDLRGHTMTRNQRYFFAIDHGEVCFKERQQKASSQWRKLEVPEAIDGKVEEISADDELLVVRISGQASLRMVNSLSTPKKFKWEGVKGFPFGSGESVVIPEDAVGWDISLLSPKTDQFYLDRLGEHTVGVGCTTLFILLKDGQRITYKDPWLPVDETNQVCGPMRGKLKAVAFSASGSTLFEMDKNGNSFGLRYDFDIAGADRVFIRYSYQDRVGSLGFLNRLLSPRKLPIDGWFQLPRLPFSDGFFTHLISVEKTGLGARYREFRIEGTKEGHSGYFRLVHDFVPEQTSQSAVETWEFVITDKPILGKWAGLTGTEQPTELDLGEPVGQNLVAQAGDLTLQIEDFNGYCSPSTLKILFDAKQPTLDLKLHSHESLRVSKANAQDPLSFHGAIEIPADLLANTAALPPAQLAFLKQFLGVARYTKVKLHRSPKGLTIKSSSSLTRTGIYWNFRLP